MQFNSRLNFESSKIKGFIELKNQNQSRPLLKNQILKAEEIPEKREYQGHRGSYVRPHSGRDRSPRTSELGNHVRSNRNVYHEPHADDGEEPYELVHPPLDLLAAKRPELVPRITVNVCQNKGNRLENRV